MSLVLLLETALREIAAHKFRSLLSMLGIVLGVSSLIATMALTAGIETGTRAFMQQIGGLEFVRVVDQEIPAEMIEFWDLSPGRTIRDAKSILASAPLISHVSPEMSQGAVVSSSEASDRKRVNGVWPDFYVIERHAMQAGRFLTELDIERATRAVVIGQSAAEEFFPGNTPEQVVGKKLLINDSPFSVVGVFEFYERDRDKRRRELAEKRGKNFVGRKRARDPFRGKNNAILIPLSTMFYEFKSGQFPFDSLETMRINDLTLQVKDLKYFRAAVDQVRSALLETHRGVEDFDFVTREEWFDRMESSIAATRMSGGLIAVISLIVGGIGITNIMLASITERVREIGIRMAVGARGRDIFYQILVESVTIAFLGGLAGIAAGVGLIQILVVVAPSENEPLIRASSFVLSVVFAIAAGVVSGIYPALKASKLEPISALRYE